MEINDLQNKSEKLFKDLSGSIEGVLSLAMTSLDEAKKVELELMASLTPKQLAEVEAFQLKYANLIKQGKLVEAKELKQSYTDEQF